MESYILLENAEIYAKHGVFPQETIVGNVFLVNLKIKIDLSQAAKTDSLDDTLSYATVFNMVQEEMEVPSKLLEHAGGRIIERLKHYCPAIEKIELKISKRNPPVDGEIEFASVILID